MEEYYEKLCKKFPQISFNTNGGVVPCNSNKVVVNLSYDCLKKMANDPEFAKEIEWNLSGEVAANSQVYSFAKRDGVELGGRTVTYDANGNRQSSCGGMRTANSSNKSSDVLSTQNQQKAAKSRRDKKREQEEYLEKMREKRKRDEEYCLFPGNPDITFLNLHILSKKLHSILSSLDYFLVSFIGRPNSSRLFVSSSLIVMT